jgi:ligand-binding sensor domain-containing protein
MESLNNKKMTKRLCQCFTFVWIFCAFSAPGQEPLFHLVENDLSSQINQYRQDHNGFLWMATETGMVYYNGHVFSSVSEPTSAYSSDIFGQHIYVGKDSGIIEIIDLYTKISREIIQLPTNSKVSGLYMYSDNLGVVATYGSGLFMINREDNNYTSAKVKINLPSEFLYELLFHNEHIYLATDRGLAVIEGENLTSLDKEAKCAIVNDLPDQIITDIAASDDQLVIGSYDGYIYEITADHMIGHTRKPVGRDKLYDLVITDQGIYATYESGLYYLHNLDKNAVAQLLKTINHPKKLLVVDNNLWVTNQKKQLYRGLLNLALVDTGIKTIQAIEQMSDHIVIGTPTGLYIYSEKSKSRDQILTEVNVTTIKRYDNLLFVGTYTKGLYVFNERFHEVAHYQQIHGLSNNTVLDIEPISYKNILVSTLAGVAKLTFDFKYGNYLNQDSTYSPNMGYSYVLDIFQDSENVLWFGKDRTGVLKFEDNNLLEIDTFSQGRKLGSVYAVTETESKSIWMSTTRQGIILYQDNAVISFENKKAADQPYTSILALEDSILLGIKDQSVDLIKHRDDNLSFHTLLYSETGTPTFLNNFCFHQDQNKLIFVFNDQIYIYNIPSSFENAYPKVIIEEVAVNLDPIQQNRRKFSQSENNFQFTYTETWVESSDRISYSYMLEGFDKDWRKTKDRSVSYPHLPPGGYNFRIKASSNTDFSTSSIASFPFTVGRYFYNTIWFYLIMSIGIVSSIFWSLKKRQKDKLMAAELEQRKIETQLINLQNQLNPHFLFNSFNTLMGLIEEDSKKSTRYLEHMTDFYRGILAIGTDELITVEKELTLVKIYIYLLKERFGEGLQVYLPEKHISSLIPPLTIQMLLENAVKHNIVNKQNPLVITIENSETELIICNNRIPKLSKQITTEIGLQNIKKRYLLITGKSVDVKISDDHFKVILPVITPK